MGFQTIGATREQPATLIHGDIDLAGIDHFADFFQILLAIAGTARVHQFPGLFVGTLARGVSFRWRRGAWIRGDGQPCRRATSSVRDPMV